MNTSVSSYYFDSESERATLGTRQAQRLNSADMEATTNYFESKILCVSISVSATTFQACFC